ncbi:MAG: hypothetical protein KDB03_21785 [Planctomycetales bacterium]|nr:hypothetical protein [Planctomycetales bacterium]
MLPFELGWDAVINGAKMKFDGIQWLNQSCTELEIERNIPSNRYILPFRYASAFQENTTIEK